MPHLRFYTDSDDWVKTNAVYAEYERYWRDNRTRFPADLLRINGGMLPDHCFDHPDDAIFLHDARIRTFEVGESDIAMLLDGDNRGAWREIHIKYTGVTDHTAISDALMSNSPESDLMTHETTITEDGHFNHTMLFANGEILSIQFTDCDVKIVDHPLTP